MARIVGGTVSFDCGNVPRITKVPIGTSAFCTGAAGCTGTLTPITPAIPTA
jgi:hypothetical protein